jgi:hypothetical protein
LELSPLEGNYRKNISELSPLEGNYQKKVLELSLARGNAKKVFWSFPSRGETPPKRFGAFPRRGFYTKIPLLPFTGLANPQKQSFGAFTCRENSPIKRFL